MVLIFLFSSLLLSKPSVAQNTNDILLRLRQNDEQVLQGIIVYDDNPHFYRVIANIPPPPSVPSREWVIYSKNGCYKIISKNANNPDLIIQTGGGGNNFIEGSNSIMTAKPSHPSPPFGDMCTGPCAPLGRGLTSLKDLVIIRKKGVLTAVGKYGDDITIQANLDAKHGYLAKEITGYNQDNKIILNWKIGGWKKCIGGVWIPQHSVSYFHVHLNNGKYPIILKRTYHILQASFQSPPSSAFNLSVKGKTVFDDRFGVPVGGKQEFPGESLNQILQGTGSVAHQLIQLREAAERAKSRERLIQALVTGLFVFTLIAFIWIMRRRKTPA